MVAREVCRQGSLSMGSLSCILATHPLNPFKPDLLLPPSPFQLLAAMLRTWSDKAEIRTVTPGWSCTSLDESTNRS